MWPSRLEISPLLPVHRGALGLHLLALAPDDRYARFGMTLSDEAVLRWVARIAWTRQRWWGAWLQGDLGLQAVLQLSPTRRAGAWELTMTVHAALRGQGLGTALLAAAMGQMPEVQHLLCQHGHAAMPAMARRLGYGVQLCGQPPRLEITPAFAPGRAPASRSSRPKTTRA